jgi:hypothetical protein
VSHSPSTASTASGAAANAGSFDALHPAREASLGGGAGASAAAATTAPAEEGMDRGREDGRDASPNQSSAAVGWDTPASTPPPPLAADVAAQHAQGLDSEGEGDGAEPGPAEDEVAVA